MRSKQVRRIRRPIFVACEGKSEAGYIKWFNHLAGIQDVPVHITARDMKGGGAASILEKAIKFLMNSSGGMSVYRKKYLLLDYDTSANSRHDLDRTKWLAQQHSFGIIWQHICHECFLLKHFSETENRNPSIAVDCQDALLGVWPAYRKGLDATKYEERMTNEHLNRARGNLPELDAFLNEIGWN